MSNQKGITEPKWDEKIQEDYPFMRRERYEQSPFYNFGFECREGWSQIIRDACEAITKRYAEEGIAPEDIDFIPAQIKEKFGTLRFYYEYLDRTSAFENFETGVSMRVKSNIKGLDERTKKFREDIDKIVEEAERKSESVCESCGAPGTLRDDRDKRIFWLETLCDSCHDKKLKAVEERRARPRQDISEFLE